MKNFIVLYRDEKIMCPADAPFQFACQADDADHAEEQCLNAYPEVDVVWVHQGEFIKDALDDYWHGSETCSLCGERAVGGIIGCPDGAEICRSCFDSGRH